MQNYMLKLAQAVAGVALLAGAYSLPAAAAEQYRYHHRYAHHYYHPADNGDVVVRTGAHREPVAAAPDAFHGPAAIITAPIAIAGTIVSLPFQALKSTGCHSSMYFTTDCWRSPRSKGYKTSL